MLTPISDMKIAISSTERIRQRTASSGRGATAGGAAAGVAVWLIGRAIQRAGRRAL